MNIEQLLGKIELDSLEIKCYLELLKKSSRRVSNLALKLKTPKATF